MNEIIGLLPAAGRGSRLGPIPCSKEIMPLGFQRVQTSNGEEWQPVTTIATHLHSFKLAGVKQVALIVSKSKCDLMYYLGSGERYGLPIAYFFQENLSGMPIALDLPYLWLKQATVLFSMPDTVITPGEILRELVQCHRRRSADVTLGLFPTDAPEKFGMVELDANGHVIGFIDKPAHSDLKLMWGCAAWSPRFTNFLHDFTARLPATGNESVLSDVFQAALNNGLEICAKLFPTGRYHDIGLPESFQTAVYDFALRQAAIVQER
jgi:glucose-1-phosphate thymidylyltransferase